MSVRLHPGELNGIIVMALTDTVTHSVWIWTQKIKTSYSRKSRVCLKCKGKTLWSKLFLQLGKVDMCGKLRFSHVTRFEQQIFETQNEDRFREVGTFGLVLTTS